MCERKKNNKTCSNTHKNVYFHFTIDQLLTGACIIMVTVTQASIPHYYYNTIVFMCVHKLQPFEQNFWADTVANHWENGD